MTDTLLYTQQTRCSLHNTLYTQQAHACLYTTDTLLFAQQAHATLYTTGKQQGFTVSHGTVFIPQTEEPGGLRSIGSQRVRYD